MNAHLQELSGKILAHCGNNQIHVYLIYNVFMFKLQGMVIRT